MEGDKVQTKRLMFPEVKPIFKDANAPRGFVNDVHGWTFTRDEVKEAAGAGKLLTLDIDMAGKGVCSLKCGHCFRRTAEFMKEKRLTTEELMKHIHEAKTLGLRSVKLIGPGEPLEEKGLLGFLQALVELGITPLIFTKGHVLGDEGLCMRIHGMGTAELAGELKKLGTSILLGTTSFDQETEDRIVKMEGHLVRRNQGIARLAEARFNEFIPGQPTMLAFCVAPITPLNIDEAFEIYLWARERHIQPVLAPTMNSGKALGMIADLIVPETRLLALFTAINIHAIEHGFTTLEELETQGISPYPGAAPCNQIAVGMFLRGDGKVLRCPGDDVSIQGDLRERSLSGIWQGSDNRIKFAGQYNNFCPPKDGVSFPHGFFGKVLEQVKAYFRQDRSQDERNH